MAQAAALLQTQAPPASALRAVPGASERSAERVLRIPAYDLAAALTLERELGISHVLSQILVRRGFGQPDAAREFLAAGVAHDPATFDGIERALEPIERQIAAGARITVHGDYDVDGVCATAIMVRALRALGADVGWYLPGRLEDGYGLALHTVERLAARGTALLVTVDCAITAVDEVAAARAAGLEVVVTDHHAQRPDGRLPDCPIVHPAYAATRSTASVARRSPTSLRRRSERRRPMTTSSWSRSRQSPTSCRWSTRTGGSCGRAWRRSRTLPSPACGH